MKRTTSKQIVLAAHPDATSHYSRTENAWFIWDRPRPTDGSQILARRANVRAAWNDAARRVQAR